MKPKFLTKVPKLSTTVVTQKELEEMTAYKLLLVDYMCYGNCKVGLQQTSILHEIQETERWLKKQWSIFLHDKNRSLKLTA